MYVCCAKTSCNIEAPASIAVVCFTARLPATSNSSDCFCRIAFLANALRPSFCTSFATLSATASAFFFDTPDLIALCAACAPALTAASEAAVLVAPSLSAALPASRTAPLTTCLPVRDTPPVIARPIPPVAIPR